MERVALSSPPIATTSAEQRAYSFFEKVFCEDLGVRNALVLKRGKGNGMLECALARKVFVQRREDDASVLRLICECRYVLEVAVGCESFQQATSFCSPGTGRVESKQRRLR